MPDVPLQSKDSLHVCNAPHIVQSALQICARHYVSRPTEAPEICPWTFTFNNAFGGVHMENEWRHMDTHA